LTYGLYDVQFAWSPDGQTIAVTTEHDNAPDIYVMNINGRNSAYLDRAFQNRYSPAWSPDGHFIAYVTSCSPGSNQLAITNVDTGNTRYFVHKNHFVSNPAWSSDGKHIVFVSQVTDVVKSELYDLDVASEKISALNAAPGYDMYAVWSPNNRYLLFLQAQPKAALYIRDSLSNKTTLLDADNVNIYDTPTWSSDSRSILFTRFVNNYRGDTAVFQLDVESCLEQSAACIPQELVLPLSIYLNPRWWPHQP
jgi:Tol biopolymer transport system component